MTTKGRSCKRSLRFCKIIGITEGMHAAGQGMPLLRPAHTLQAGSCLEGGHAFARQLISPLIFRVAGMAFHPVPLDLVALDGQIQRFP